MANNLEKLINKIKKALKHSVKKKNRTDEVKAEIQTASIKIAEQIIKEKEAKKAAKRLEKQPAENKEKTHKEKEGKGKSKKKNSEKTSTVEKEPVLWNADAAKVVSMDEKAS